MGGREGGREGGRGKEVNAVCWGGARGALHHVKGALPLCVAAQAQQGAGTSSQQQQQHVYPQCVCNDIVLQHLLALTRACSRSLRPQGSPGGVLLASSSSPKLNPIACTTSGPLRRPSLEILQDAERACCLVPPAKRQRMLCP